jgi:hypothetical protein
MTKCPPLSSVERGGKGVHNKPGKWVSTGANNNEMTDINFSMIFSDGPAVSFIGSPVVSPTTAAL